MIVWSVGKKKKQIRLAQAKEQENQFERDPLKIVT